MELALLAPLLVLLLLGIWSVSRAYGVKTTLDDAVREGARFGANVVPWNPESDEAILAVIETELSSAGVAPEYVTVGCIELIERGQDGCDTGDGSLVTAAPANQVAIEIRLEDYPLSFVFFSLEVDLTSDAVSRHES